MSRFGQIGAAISLFCIIIGIVSFFLPSPGWVVSVGMFLIVFFVWFTKFTWRIATAADNIIEKYQDDNIQEKRIFHIYKEDQDNWNKSKFRWDES